MKNRRAFLLKLATATAALLLVIGPVIAADLLGVITKVDVDGKKLTVVEKGTDKEVVVTVTADTDVVTTKGSAKIDLEKLAKGVAKAQDAGKKGTTAKVTHENGVASSIAVGKKAAE
jgi:hypothetical protein